MGQSFFLDCNSVLQIFAFERHSNCEGILFGYLLAEFHLKMSYRMI